VTRTPFSPGAPRRHAGEPALARHTPCGAGLGYRYDDYKLTSTRDDFHGRVDYKFKGPQLFLEAGF